MPDLQVLIKILTQEVGQEKADQVLKRVKEEAQASGVAQDQAGQVGVKAQKEIAEATEKTFASKKDLRSAVKGLMGDFPIVGQIARLALNPITLAVTAITSGIVLFNKRVQELTISLGGIEMPDLSETQVQMIERQAAAWGKVAENLGKVTTESGKVKTSLDASLKLIKFLDDFNKATGGKGTDADAATARKKNAAADTLEANAREAKRKAGTPGSEEDEKSFLDTSAEAARKAEADKKLVESRIADLRAFESDEGSFLDQIILGSKIQMRYGVGASVENGLAMEYENLGQQNAIIARYKNAQMDAGTRKDRRASISQADADLEQAARLRGEAGESMRSDIVGRGAASAKQLDQAAQSITGAVGAADFGSLAVAMLQFTKAISPLPQIISDLRTAKAQLEKIAADAGSRSKDAMNR